MINFERVGDWGKARRILRAAPERVKKAGRRAMLQEMHLLRRFIVEGIRGQNPGGKRMRPLAKSTLATRRIRTTGRRTRASSKALIQEGDLMGSIAVIQKGNSFFVGVHRQTKSSTGESMVNIAKINEFGSRPIVIPITPAMRRFLGILFRHLKRPTAGSGRGVVVVVIPPRPFMRPAFEQWTAQLKSRFFARVVGQLPELHSGGS